MAKKDRNRTVRKYDTPMGLGLDEEHFGIIKYGERIKIDIKRLRKVGEYNGKSELVDFADNASKIPRNTKYFVPKKKKRSDYVVNQFIDEFEKLKERWHEQKKAFENIKNPNQVQDQTYFNNIQGMCNMDDIDEVNVHALLKGIERIPQYLDIKLMFISQFIHQMATELDALLLRSARKLGFDLKEITRYKIHNYLNGTQKGKHKIEDLEGFDNYIKFFTVHNFMKHNSESLYEKVLEKYPEMLKPTTKPFQNGNMAIYYLNIDEDYITTMFRDLLEFYKNLCETFFDENAEESKWNYDEYLEDKINEYYDQEDWRNWI